MNVVIVNDYGYVNGGASKVAITTAIALADAGIRVHFFCGVGPIAPELVDRPNLQATCLNTTPYNKSADKRRAIFAGIWDRTAKAALVDSVSSMRTDDTVIHFHSHRDALSPSVVTAATGRAFPAIYTCHEYGLACPYSSFYHHGIDGICPHRGLSIGCVSAHCNRGSYGKKIWTVGRQLVQRSYATVPASLSDVIYVSNFSKAILESYVPTGVREHVLANPIPVEKEAPRKLEPHAPFVFVGLLTPGKDPVMLARAGAVTNFPIEFYGDGELADDIKTANPQAVVSGWLEQPELLAKLKKARAIVLPARWYETQGLVIQEAAALGVPAIVSRTCAATDFVDDGSNGLYCEAANLESLTSAMTALKDDGLACEMGQRAYAKFWSNPPTMKGHMEGLLQIYEGALAHG